MAWHIKASPAMRHAVDQQARLALCTSTAMVRQLVREALAARGVQLVQPPTGRERARAAMPSMKLPGTMRVPDDLRRRIVDLAVRDDRSMSSAIRMILRAGLRTLEKTAETTFEPDFSDDEIAGDVLAIDALGADQATA